MIFDRIRSDLLSIKEGIEEVRIGLSYVGVLLKNSNLGLAYTFLPREHKCSLFEEFGFVKGRRICDIVKKVSLKDEITYAVFLACANAYHNTLNKKGLLEGDVLSIISIEEKDVVGMVGEFKPLIAPLRARCQKLYVFERKADQSTEEVLPEKEAYFLLKKCNVVIITATSIINETIDLLLEGAHKAREVVILGPSTPLNPEYFKETPVTLLSGVVVKDVFSVLDVISLGGGMRSFNRFVKKVSVRVKDGQQGDSSS